MKIEPDRDDEVARDHAGEWHARPSEAVAERRHDEQRDESDEVKKPSIRPSAAGFFGAHSDPKRDRWSLS